MKESGCDQPKRAADPSQRRLAREKLPLPETRRWGTRRKAEIVAAVRGGLLAIEEACARYSLSREEFLSWQNLVDRYGLKGLRTTRLQEYRNSNRNAQLAAPIQSLRIDSET